ncbi:hypothetical protein HPB48_016181 [Haemaphysalis longicornis]|uniref:Vesicle transport protein USE1 n=1 Tax=Haemaphysalis longicornis TaxID=44386 RepID=A0A9J6G7R6_HAELO|nr:hypothetical protein HPB48_016181 [Haemaphysalis longicornis]
MQPHNSPEKTLSHENIALRPAPDVKAKEILLKRQTKAIQDAREELLEFRSSSKATGKYLPPEILFRLRPVSWESYLVLKRLCSRRIDEQASCTEILLGSVGACSTIDAKDKWDSKGLRQRTPGQGAGEDFDAVLRYHNSMQEKVAEEMVSLAQNLKQNALLAGSIVKKDTEAVQKSIQTADQNYQRLQAEQSRAEEHIRRSCNCWIWLMLAVVFIVFLNMVIFMRVFPKR